MLKTFNKIYTNVDEITENLQDPFETVSVLVHALCAYNPDNEEVFYNMLQKLMGEAQPISNLLKQQIKERMKADEKWKFIGKSYFVGATNLNDYTPNVPYVVDIEDNPYSYQNEGFAVLHILCGGADNRRQITLRKMKDGRWLIWSDTILGLLSGIKAPESQNPWA